MSEIVEFYDREMQFGLDPDTVNRVRMAIARGNTVKLRTRNPERWIPIARHSGGTLVIVEMAPVVNRRPQSEIKHGFDEDFEFEVDESHGDPELADRVDLAARLVGGTLTELLRSKGLYER